jgi:hypothetical protein
MVGPSTRRTIVAKSISVGAVLSSTSGCLGTARRSEQEQPITEYEYCQDTGAFETLLPTRPGTIDSPVVCTEDMFIGLLEESRDIAAFREGVRSESILQFLDNIDNDHRDIAVISHVSGIAQGEWEMRRIVRKYHSMIHVEFDVGDRSNGHTAISRRTMVIRLPPTHGYPHLSVKAIGHKSLTTDVGAEL